MKRTCRLTTTYRDGRVISGDFYKDKVPLALMDELFLSPDVHRVELMYLNTGLIKGRCKPENRND